ncbi:hypothetical protein L1987_35106 [Smallanthus sonchifolius]|uniref:Uncharacterized protein n=1 Tax=Smallanthus sonchifolius TaxID=185202 RepID=A0ACB9HWU8_9ASTR|nr:hypothetical protein L1987_35106 [Smallanthus sonchifolius]
MVALPMKRSREDGYDTTITNIANYLMLLSRGTEPYGIDSVNRVFECKTCNRQFTSFQALGGHRASHKKPRLVDGDHMVSHHDEISPSKSKSHKCSICGLEFAIGQALGGHMRRHRAALTTEEQSTPQIDLSSPVVKKVNSRRVFSLDLNLTPLENDFGFRVDDEKVTPITVDFFL